jgi:hypothetical protein
MKHVLTGGRWSHCFSRSSLSLSVSHWVHFGLPTRNTCTLLVLSFRLMIANGMGQILRFECVDGKYRLEIQNFRATMVADLLEMLEKLVKVPASVMEIWTKGPRPHCLKHRSLASHGLRHGDELSLRYPDEYEAGIGLKGSRKEMGSEGGDEPELALKDLRRAWTIRQYIEHRQHGMEKVEEEESGDCTKFELSGGWASELTTFLSQSGFQYMRMVWILGVVRGDGVVVAKTTYEPPQESFVDGFSPLEDGHFERVQRLAIFMHMTVVGWLFTHRKRDFEFSAAEVHFASQQQHRFGKHFVTVCGKVDEKGKVSFEPYQMSRTCVRLVAEGMFDLHNPEEVDDEKFIHELKCNKPVLLKERETTVVDVNFCVVTVPIVAAEEERPFSTRFGIENRPTGSPAPESIAPFVAANKGINAPDLFWDFHLLMALFSHTFDDDVYSIFTTRPLCLHHDLLTLLFTTMYFGMDAGKHASTL